jgi:glycolate oxidase FAD binding subunit
MLACEPPHFGKASIGGMLAAGLAGPRRPFFGSVSDQVLGCTIMNGRGEVLRFGGRVMKNVAGYDLSRLMVGSMGCLGIILEATLKVLPRAAVEETWCFSVESTNTPQFINRLRLHSLPVTASCHDGEKLRVRFSGGHQEIATLGQRLDRIADFISREREEGNQYWTHVREHTLPFFSEKRNLWRLSVPATTPVLPIPGNTLTEWNGALRWCYTDAAPADVFEAVSRAGGSASLFRADAWQRTEIRERFQPLAAPVMAWHQALKSALDPDLLLNPGRMYAEF